MKCINCGKELVEGVLVCDQCGAQQLNNASPVENVNTFEPLNVQNQQPVQGQPMVQEQPQVQPVTEPVVTSNYETQSINYYPNNNGNKKSNKVLIIAIVIIFFIVGVVVGVLLTSNGGSSNSINENSANNRENINNQNNDNGNISNNTENNEDDNGNKSNEGGNGNNNTSIDDPYKNETEEEKSARLISNVETDLTCGLDSFNRCVLKVTNNNTETINLVLSELFMYDEEGKISGIEQGPSYSNGLGSGKTGYILLSSRLMKDFSTYKPSFYLQTWFDSDDRRDEISIRYNDNKSEKKIEVYAKNNSDVVVGNIATYILFYKNDKLVAVSRVNCEEYPDGTKVERERTGTAIIKPGDETYGYTKYPQTSDYKDYVDFDRFEVVVGEAYHSTDKRRR